MNLRGRTLGCFLLVVAAADGVEQGAPLEESKRELKVLRQDLATKNNDTTTAKMTDGLPRLETPIPGALPFDLPMPGKEESDLKKKKEARKNWLLDGFNQLEKSDKTKEKESRESKTGAFVAEENKPASSDPQYILKIYDEQKKEAEAKAETKQLGAAPSDPFAPFLQDWLGASPVRGRFFDENVRKPDSEVGKAAFGGPIPGGHAQNFSPIELTTTRTSGELAQPNPYLQVLDASGPPDLGGSNNPAAIVLGAMGKQGDVSPPSSPAIASPYNPPVDNKKPPVPALSDNQKYFPQLKKF